MMKLDPNNQVVQLCAQGMELEGTGKPKEAFEFYQKAWKIAKDDFEKFIAAHYVARHQDSLQEKLNWDIKALKHALKLKNENVNETLPSLYLNIAKGYEDLREFEKANEHYSLANIFIQYLPDDPYGKMIKGGVLAGIKRIEIVK